MLRSKARTRVSLTPSSLLAATVIPGLDFAALERAKAQAEAAAEDLDDVLEETYKNTGAAAATPEPPASTSTTGKKRTREELIQELKAKRQKTDGADPVDEARKLEDAKKQGKFRPIGAPAPKEGKVKKKKKVEKATAAPAAPVPAPVAEASRPEPQVVSERAAGKQRAPEPEPEPEEDMGDMDLFDGVEEYKGLDEDDDENDATPPPRAASPAAGATQAKWFDLDDGLGTLPAAPARPPTPPPVEAQEQRCSREDSPDEDVRLAPLASSSFSIKDVLAMDQELEKEDKRKARKEKKKKEAGGEKTKLSGEAKANRDLQKLESYTSKKRG